MRLFADNAKATLANSINDSTTTIVLNTGEGDRFPSPSDGDFFDLTLTQDGPETSWEIVKVTERDGDTLTCERGQYGTTAQEWEANDKAELRVHAAAVEDFATLGKMLLGVWPASAIKPQTTNGCAALAWDESSTNKVMTPYLAFDPASIEYGQFSFKAPAGLDVSAGFTFILEWMEAGSASSHDVVWQVEAQAQGDGDTVDSAWGSAVTVTDTGTSGTRRFTAETGTVTPGGSWAPGDEIIVRVSRKATDGNDTLNVDAKLLSVTAYAIVASTVEA
jgi:hypothetical protein